MFDRKKGERIDAGAELERAEHGRMDGEFDPSVLAQRRPITPGGRTFMLVLVFCVSALLVTLSYKAWTVQHAMKDKKEKKAMVQQVIPEFTQKPIPDEPRPSPETPKPLETPQAVPNALLLSSRPQEKDGIALARERMLKSGLSNTQENTDGGHLAGSQDPSNGQMGGGELAEKLQPMRLSGSRASQLKNRDLLITEGTQLDCVLETKVITTQPGMTTCHLTRDVYSTSGRVVLLDRGSKVVGFYQGGLRQGQARIFVQWSRIETPNGVLINLDSPGTGPLGEAGIGGWIDTHFWERFGGAILISVIGDLGEWAGNQGKSQSGGSIQFSNTSNGVESASVEALRNTINIPPTLYKNQGERVNILVARDLDFSDVYTLVAD